jgi:hypothetical protein
MLLGELIFIYYGNYKEHINMSAKCKDFNVNPVAHTVSTVLYSEHTLSVKATAIQTKGAAIGDMC